MQKNRGNIIVGLLVALVMAVGGVAITYLSRFEPDRDGLTLVETLAQTPELSDFNKLLQDNGILAELESKDKTFTIFAPTNTALKAAKKQLDKLKGEDKKNQLILLLRNHIVEDKVFSFSLQTLTELDAISGEVLPIKYDQAKKTTKVGGALIGKADTRASNGMIHQIDALAKVKED